MASATYDVLVRLTSLDGQASAVGLCAKFYVERYHHVLVAIFGMSLFAASLFAFITLSADVPVKIENDQGKKTDAILVSISSSAIEVRRAGNLDSLAYEDLVKLSLPNEISDGTAEVPRVVLIDGTTLRCQSISSKGSLSRIQLDETLSAEVSTNLIQNVQLAELSETQREKWETICQKQLSSDLVALLRPDDAIEPIEGIVNSVTSTAVNFDFGGQAIDIPLERIAGFRTFTTQEVDANKKAIATVTDITGNKYSVTLLSSNDSNTSLNMTLLCGLELDVPYRQLHEIDFEVGRSLYLSKLEPLTRTASNHFKFNVEIPGSNNLFGPQSFDFRPADSRTTIPSIQFAGGGTTTYRIPEGFQRLVADVRLSPESKRVSPCHVSIRLDNKVAWEAELRSPANEIPVDIAVQPDQRLQIDVTPKSSTALGDFVIWVGIRLLK